MAMDSHKQILYYILSPSTTEQITPFDLDCFLPWGLISKKKFGPKG